MCICWWLLLTRAMPGVPSCHDYYHRNMPSVSKSIYIGHLKAGVTRCRSLVLDKQKRFQLSSELAETVRWLRWSRQLVPKPGSGNTEITEMTTECRVCVLYKILTSEAALPPVVQWLSSSPPVTTKIIKYSSSFLTASCTLNAHYMY